MFLQENDQYSLLHFSHVYGDGPPLHIHENDDEFFYILEGTFEFLINGEKRILHAGDTLFAPRGCKHKFMCISEQGGKQLIVISPGKGATYFRETVRLLEKSGTKEDFWKLGEKYGIRILKE